MTSNIISIEVHACYDKSNDEFRLKTVYIENQLKKIPEKF